MKKDHDVLKTIALIFAIILFTLPSFIAGISFSNSNHKTYDFGYVEGFNDAIIEINKIIEMYNIQDEIKDELEFDIENMWKDSDEVKEYYGD